MRLAPALAVALVALLAPAALADHVWSHRLYVVGRVVDADGLPAPGLAVNVTFSNLTTVGACYDSDPETTGPRGDYEVCRHAHALPADSVVTIRVGDATREVRLDRDLRHATANLRLGAARELRDFEGDIEFARAVRVMGRSYVLLPEPVTAEMVEVNASPLGGNVTVEIRAGAEVLASRNVTPSEHGLYAAELPVGELPAGATARVQLGPDVSEVAIDPAVRRADVNVVRDLRLFAGPGDDAPGSSPTSAAPWLALAAGLIAAGARRARRPR